MNDGHFGGHQPPPPSGTVSDRDHHARMVAALDRVKAQLAMRAAKKQLSKKRIGTHDAPDARKLTTKQLKEELAKMKIYL